MSWLGAAIGAGASIIGGVLGNKASAKQAAKDRDFQERMARNKHQYEVADLRAAGLNPILSANSGAAIPSGAMAAQQNVASGAADAFASVSNARTAKKQQEKAGELVDAQIKTEESQQLVNLSNAKKLDSEAAHLDADTNMFPLRQAFTNAQIKQAEAATQRTIAAIANDKAIADSEVAKNFAQAFQAYKAGELSAAQVQTEYAKVVNLAVQNGKISQETANLAILAVGYQLDNDRKSYENVELSYDAKYWDPDSPANGIREAGHNFGKFVRDINPLAGLFNALK